MRPLVLALLLPSAALAQEDPCADGFDGDDLTARIEAVDAAVGAFDLDEARNLLFRTKEQLHCLPDVVDRRELTRFAQRMALAYFLDQDEISAVRWGMLARYTAPDEPWPEIVGPDHPLRETLDFTEQPPLAGPDASIVPPKKGGVFLNGMLLETPKARAEVPNLVQVFDKNAEVVDAYWQDGSAFREEILGEPGLAPPLPRWYEPEGGAVSSRARASSGPNVTRLAVGGGLAVLSGTLYALSAVSLSGLEAAEDIDQLAAARSRVNLLALGAGATGAAAVGVGVTAFVAGEPGLGIHLRF